MKKNQIITKNLIFESHEFKNNLASKAFTGGLFTMFSQGIMFCINTTSTIILARLLSPSDYGIVGMAMVVVSFAKMFMEAGLSTATIQAKNIFHEQVSALFWANTAIGVILGFIVLVSAPILAMFYGQPEVLPVTASLSLTFFISGLGIQHMAILRRHMRFGSLAIVYVFADLVNVITAITLALIGLRYWAIIFGLLAMSVLKTAGMYYFCRWIPCGFRRNTGLRASLKFGRNITAANFFMFLSKSIDSILIGKLMGSSALGLYQKAYRLFMLPVNEIRSPLTNVSLSTLSALKNTPNRFKKYFFRIVDLLATATLPITFYCFVEAEFIITTLLGQQWLGVIPVFRILALGGIIIPISGTMGIVLLSLGKSKKYFYKQMWTMFFLILGVCIGAFFGLNGVAWGFVISNYLIFIPQLAYSFRGTPINIPDFFRILVMPVTITITACLLAKCIKILFLVNGPATNFLFLITFWLFYIALSYPRKTVKETFKLGWERVIKKPTKTKPVLNHNS